MTEVAEADYLADPANQDTLRASLADLKLAGEANTAAVRAWRGALGPEPWHARVHDALKAVETTTHEICSFVSERYLY